MIDLLATYEKGVITAGHLVVECLLRIDPEEPAKILKPLPQHVLVRMLEFANQYREGAMLSNYGRIPTAAQVAAAKKWIESKVGNGSADATLVPDSKPASSHV